MAQLNTQQDDNGPVVLMPQPPVPGPTVGTDHLPPAIVVAEVSYATYPSEYWVG
jgi:hypothetical protein